MIRYKKSDKIDKLDSASMSKMMLNVQGKDTENIWVKRFKDYSVLQNHALNFYPFSSWGAIIPSISSQYDLHDIRESKIIELHPEAFDSYVENNIITPEGDIIPKEGEEETEEP